MSEQENQDQTANFVSVSSDMPSVPAQDQQEAEEATVVDQVDDQGKDEGEEAPEAGSSPEDKSQGDTGADKTAELEKAKKSNKVQERINKVIKEREAARRENESLRAQLEAKNNSKKESVTVEPKESDFEDYDDYLQALDTYDKVTPASKPKEQNPESKDSKILPLTDSQKSAVAFLKETLSAADLPEDFEKVAYDDSVRITAEMTEALAECDDPGKVLYHLGKNKALAEEIAGQTYAQQMRSIAKLDLTVKVAPPKPVRTTKAPAPIAPVGGSDAQSKSLGEMSFAEFSAVRNKEERGSKF